MIYHFNRQSMQTLVDEILQCIIHKPMALHPGQSGQSVTAQTDPKMRASAGHMGPGMSGMRRTFIDDLEKRRRQSFLQSPSQG